MLGPKIVQIGHLGPKIQFYSYRGGFFWKTGSHYYGGLSSSSILLAVGRQTLWAQVDRGVKRGIPLLAKISTPLPSQEKIPPPLWNGLDNVPFLSLAKIFIFMTPSKNIPMAWIRTLLALLHSWLSNSARKACCARFARNSARDSKFEDLISLAMPISSLMPIFITLRCF